MPFDYCMTLVHVLALSNVLHASEQPVSSLKSWSHLQVIQGYKSRSLHDLQIKRPT